MINIAEIRQQFPILSQKINNKPLVYLDNGASSQKPKMVLDAITDYYERYNANVHRGIHTLSQIATTEMELARQKVQHFINAKYDHEIIFTKGATEGINLLAYSLMQVFKSGDEIIVSALEHHANIVPWQMLCQRTGAILKVIPMDENGILQLDAFETLLNDKTKLVAVNHISNALGVINPIKDIIAKSHHYNALVLIDGAQSAPHTKIDVQSLDADFFVFSGHKMYAPTGVGILYGKEDILNKIPPFLGGGEMIEKVTFTETTYAGLPFKFEAGTPNIEANIALGYAIDFIQGIGQDNIAAHENNLLKLATQLLSEIPEVEIYAKDSPRAGAISFNLKLDGVHPSDVGMILDKMGIAVRTGHHCAQPIMQFFGILGTVRASFAIYNTEQEVYELIKGVKLAVKMLG